MESKRIMVIGCSGSGKSTLSRKLGEKLNIPVVHLDKLLWRPGWHQVSNEEFDDLLKKEIIKDSWILDGNFNRTIKYRLDRCNTVIYLDYSRITCIIGVIKRVLANYGRTRTDMGMDCPEKFDIEFLKWIWNFNKKYRSNYYNELRNLKNKNVLILHSRRECKKFLKF
jgi:adenylate kinase family enzyme